MTVHHQPAQSAITTNSPGTPHASSGRAHAISPATRFRHPCPPLARCWLALGILPALASNAGSSGTGPPLANPYSACPRVGKGYRHLASLGASPLFHRSPPARAGRDGGPLGDPGSRQPAQPFTATTPKLRSLRRESRPPSTRRARPAYTPGTPHRAPDTPDRKDGRGCRGRRCLHRPARDTPQTPRGSGRRRRS